MSITPNIIMICIDMRGRNTTAKKSRSFGEFLPRQKYGVA
jgi:hypothetical protein